MAQTLVYEHCHAVTVTYNGSVSPQKEVCIRISKTFDTKILIKLCETDNYTFNYTCEIDNACFNRMRVEQSLEINFDELQSQIVDLLRDTQSDQMFLRLEADQQQCRMVFYEKARLKSLIFLIIDLKATNHAEIIDEMSRNLIKFKDSIKHLSHQLAAFKTQLQDKEGLLNTALTTNKIFEQQVKKDLQSLERVFGTTVSGLERVIDDNLLRLNRKLLKLTNDVEVVRAENKLKCESSVRLVNSLHNLRLENERNAKLVDELRLEVNHLNILKNNAEESGANLRQCTVRKEREVTDLYKQIDELKKDLQDATMIIAQKTKTHDEIAKDLVQANTMLVNFNNQNDALTKEIDEAREAITSKNQECREWEYKISRLNTEFEKYRLQFNVEEVSKLKQELHFARKNVQELERQNKEAIKLNGLLTKRLSETSVGNLPVNLLPPSQRNNY